MIKNTYQLHNSNIFSAYKDNAAVMKGAVAGRYYADPRNNKYDFHNEEVDILMKVETHNHPTAISPFPGPVVVAKSVTKVPRVRDPSRRPSSRASASRTSSFRVQSSRGKRTLVARPALLLLSTL